MKKSVYELIRPIAKQIAIRRLQEQEKQISIYEKFKIASVMVLLKIATFYKYITDKDYRQDCIDAKNNPAPPYTVEDEAEIFADLLISQWIQALWITAHCSPTTRRSGELSLSKLDDAMLPASGQLAEYGELSQFFNLQVFTMKDIRQILHTAQKLLPKGQALPEALIKYFESADIDVV